MEPNWEQLLVVANCSKNFKEFVEQKAYICPSTPDGFKTGFTHTRAKYLAPYVMKGAQAVSTIEGVVRVTSPTEGEIIWNNNGVSDADLIKRAIVTTAMAESNPRPPVLVFLLTDLRRTNFEHDSRAGFQQTRQYFDLTEFNVETVEDVAEAVRKTPWSGLKKVSVK